MVRYCCELVSVVHICVRITDALNYRHQTLTYNKRCYILEVTYIFNLYLFLFLIFFTGSSYFDIFSILNVFLCVHFQHFSLIFSQSFSFTFPACIFLIFIIFHFQSFSCTFLTCTFFIIFKCISNAYISNL